MSDWEDECDNVIQYDYANEDTGNNADAVDDWELSEDEAPKEVAKPVAVAAPVKPVSNKKKTPAQLAKEKEQAERAKAVELARRRAAEAEAARKAASDPNYAANKKEAERLAILQSEEQLANDLFGFSVSKPAAPAVVEEMSAEDKEMALRAARLAAATGLSDGADGMDGINDPAAKTAAEAPSPLDGVSLSTVDEIRSYGAQLCEKLLTSPIKDGNTEMFKALVAGLGGSMKVEELTEVIRVLNVAKTEANKALQGKKKKGNNKPTIKSIGSAYNSAFDDYDDDDYGRNGVDDGFF